MLFAQNVNIPDVAFKNYLLSLKDLNTDSDLENISVAEAESYNSWLGIFDSNIESLEGLQSFTSITGFKVNGTKITTIPLLTSSKITQIYCDSNLITNLPNLPLNLEILSCNNNKISTLEYLPANLSGLYVNKNQITNINSLPLGLKHFFCESNQLTSIPSLPNGLYSLNISNNQITELPKLSESLDFLNCSYNSNLNQFKFDLPSKLHVLNISNTKISSIENLPQELQQLDILNTKIICLPILPKSLYWVRINKNICLPTTYDFTFLDENDKIFNPEICNDINNSNNGCNIYQVVKGKIFYDSNDDQVFTDGLDYPLSFQNFKINENIYSSDVDGNYSFNLQNINSVYAINLIDIPNSFIEVKVSDTVRFKNYGEIRENKDLIIKSKNKIDIKVEASNWVIRPGFQTVYYITVKNQGSTIQNMKINQDFDNQYLTFDSSSIITKSIIGNKLEWELLNLKPFEEKNITVYFTAKSTTPLGTDIFSDINISINDIDEDLSNNNVKINNIVRGSYDPNDIAVNHGNNVWIGDIKNNVDFDYTIRFQNTGTDTAFTVIVKDTLPSQLNLNTIKTLTTSHDYTFSLIGNVATWTFKKINLPDSTTNKVGSNGFIKYSIKPLTTLQVDDEIKNTAHIYFDFNEAIITNTVNTKVFAVVGLENESTNNLFSVYPNPNNGIFTLNTNYEKYYVEVSNITGEIVYHTNINETTKLDLQHLAKGLYFIKVVSNDKSETKKLVIE